MGGVCCVNTQAIQEDQKYEKVMNQQEAVAFQKGSNEEQNQEEQKDSGDYEGEVVNTVVQHPDDHLSIASFDGESEGNELEWLEELRVEEDEEMRFTKNGIKERINQVIDQEIEELEEKYDTKVETDDVKAYLKKKGSQFDSKSHMTFVELTFNDQYSISWLVSAMYEPEIRIKWDTNVASVEQDKKTKNSFLNYQLNKGKYGVSGRQFIDKYITFSSDGVFYVYSSAVPSETEDQKDLPAKTERARTILGYQRLFRDNESGQIKLQSVQQADLKLNYALKSVVGKYIGSTLQDWQRQLNEHVLDQIE